MEPSVQRYELKSCKRTQNKAQEKSDVERRDVSVGMTQSAHTLSAS